MGYNVLNHREFRKGYILNDTYNKPTLFDTGKHIYKNAYNFYNNTKEGQIGASKGINTFNNSILLTPNTPKGVGVLQENTTQSSSSNWDTDDLGSSLDGLKSTADFVSELTLNGSTSIDGICGYSKQYPLAIEISNLPSEVVGYYISFGIRKTGETITFIDTVCSDTGVTITISIHKNIFQLGYIPFPTLYIDLTKNQPFSAHYAIWYPKRIIDIQSASEKEIYCASNLCLTVLFFQCGFEQHATECGPICGVAQCYKAWQACGGTVGGTDDCWCPNLIRGYSIIYTLSSNVKLKIYWRKIKLNYACNL